MDNFLPDKESDSSDDEDNTITYSASFLSSQDTNKKGVAGIATLMFFYVFRPSYLA